MNIQLNISEKDTNNEEIILSKDNEQVMMEWEKPYMEASIDFLSPKGDVLEIGFGCGYSASQIMKHPIKSYTIIEISPTIIENIKKWREKYSHIPVNIIEGSWQEKLSTLGKFDEIYFDDFPLNINEKSSDLEKAISIKRINIFIDLCIQNHTKIGSKICFYLNGNGNGGVSLSSDSEPFVKKEIKEIDIEISNLCKYRDLKEQKCTIPLITKIKEFSLFESQKFAYNSIKFSLRKTICLNMIVKDESKIIASTLENLCSYINFDYWIISDTGSTDNTQEIIRDFFNERGISGELIENEWTDFGYNRTLALDAAFNKTDYLFLFDADDRITGDFEIPNQLMKDKYLCIFGTSSFKYLRPNLISNRKRWKFKGILHEFLTNMDTMNGEEIIKGDYRIDIGVFGSRANNPNKYQDDALMLEKAFEEEKEEHLKNRYAFYCAQSYKDSKNYEEALIWYLKVLELNNWNQEKYYSCVQLGKLYFHFNNENDAVKILSKASQYDGERIDSIAALMKHYYEKGNHLLVNALYNKFKDYDKEKNENKLFVDIDSLSWIEYYNSISAYYVDDRESGLKCCQKLLDTNKHVEIVKKNIHFYQ